MTLRLNPRVSEIASKIPKSVRTAVLNAVLARSLEEGILQKELSYHLSQEELERVLEDISGDEFVISKKRGRPKKPKPVRTIEHRAKEKIVSEDEVLGSFIGFDED